MGKDFLIRSQQQRKAFFEKEGRRLARLAREGQAPETLFIGCSDSRVVAESLTGARPGDLFVVRVVANIVPPYGSGQHGVHAAVEFAVTNLKVRRIIVCGHTECGGVRGMDSDLRDLPGVSEWLTHAGPVRERVDAMGLEGPDRHRAMVEVNVRQQLEHLRTYPHISEAVAEGRLALHGWVFDLPHLQMRWLDDDGRFHLFEDPAETASK